MSKKEVLSPVVINKNVVLVEDVEPEEIPMKKLEAGDFKGLRELLKGKDRASHLCSVFMAFQLRRCFLRSVTPCGDGLYLNVLIVNTA